MRALAARFLTMADELRMPTWADAWHIKEATIHGVDAAIAVDEADPLVIAALECRLDEVYVTARRNTEPIG